MRRSRRASPLYLLIVLNLPAAACTHWRVQNVEPAQLVAQAHPAEVRIERRDGRKIRLRHPTVLGSEIRAAQGVDTLRVPLADVASIAVKRTDWVETSLLIAAPPALLFGLACLAACGY
jgi:hypothetical protein